jgi:hypothetical protein
VRLHNLDPTRIDDPHLVLARMKVVIRSFFQRRLTHDMCGPNLFCATQRAPKPGYWARRK